jgi:iduronate 2-sulfatase
VKSKIRLFRAKETCLVTAVVFGALMLLLKGGVRAIDRPNVLFIAIDDLNGYVGCLGDPNAKTPHLDRLAKRGVLFTGAHCQAPICGPSRASLMTGLLPSTTGIYGQIKDTQIKIASEPARNAILLPDYLENHGYVTYGCGKLFHNGDRAKVFDEFGHGTNFGPKPGKRFVYDPAWFEKRIGNTQMDWGGVFPETDDKMPDHQTADWILAKLEALSKEA